MKNLLRNCIQLVFFGTLLTCCGKHEKGDLQKDNFPNLHINDMFYRVELLPLETKDFYLASIGKIQIYHDYFYILDDNQNTIVSYSSKGKFRFSYKAIGRGPGELINIDDFSVNTKDSTLLIYSNRMKKMVFIDCETGQFRKERKTKYFANSVACDENGNILMLSFSKQYGDIKNSVPWGYFLIDQNDSLVKILHESKLKKSDYLLHNNYIRGFGDNITFITPKELFENSIKIFELRDTKFKELQSFSNPELADIVYFYWPKSNGSHIVEYGFMEEQNEKNPKVYFRVGGKGRPDKDYNNLILDSKSNTTLYPIYTKYENDLISWIYPYQLANMDKKIFQSYLPDGVNIDDFNAEDNPLLLKLSIKNESN